MGCLGTSQSGAPPLDPHLSTQTIAEPPAPRNIKLSTQPQVRFTPHAQQMISSTQIFSKTKVKSK
jgi:hypothetical protein